MRTHVPTHMDNGRGCSLPATLLLVGSAAVFLLAIFFYSAAVQVDDYGLTFAASAPPRGADNSSLLGKRSSRIVATYASRASDSFAMAAISVLASPTPAALSIPPSATPSPPSDTRTQFGNSAPSAVASASAAQGWAAVQNRVDCLARSGRWQQTPTLQLPVIGLMQGESGCPWVADPFLRSQHPALYYNWTGHVGCTLQAFSRAEFCAALARRGLDRVMIVGDSMSNMLHDVLVSAMLYGVTKVHDHNQRMPCPGHDICVAEAEASAHLPLGHPQKALRRVVRYFRNDPLSLVDEDRQYTTRAWLRFVTNGTMLIVNRGVHAQPDDDAYITQVHAALRAAIDRAPRALIVWRSTIRPHLQGRGVKTDPAMSAANAALLPLTSSPAFDERTLDIDPTWKWWIIPRQLRLVEDLVNNVTMRFWPEARRRFSRVRTPRLVYLDADASTGLRADHHRDPVHYCIPGPVDHWLALLQGVLQATALADGS